MSFGQGCRFHSHSKHGGQQTLWLPHPFAGTRSEYPQWLVFISPNTLKQDWEWWLTQPCSYSCFEKWPVIQDMSTGMRTHRDSNSHSRGFKIIQQMTFFPNNYHLPTDTHTTINPYLSKFWILEMVGVVLEICEIFSKSSKNRGASPLVLADWVDATLLCTGKDGLTKLG